METHEKVFAGLMFAAMMVTAGLLTYVWTVAEPAPPGQGGGLLSAFSDRSEVVDFLESSERTDYPYYNEVPKSSMGTGEQDSSSDSYSRTNVQVAGVDEMDTVKTDGKYIYIASWDAISILNAYPPTALGNVSVINEKSILGNDETNRTLSFSGLFILPQKLVAVCSWHEYSYVIGPIIYNDSDKVEFSPPAYYFTPRSYVLVFDISEPAQPKLDFSIGVSGYVQSARMIEDKVYLIAQHYDWMIQDETVLPMVWTLDDSAELQADDIYYDPEMRDASSFLNVLAVDVSSQEHECLSVIAGYSSTIYMSKQAIFLTVQKWVGDIIMVDGSEKVEDSDTTTTTIFKVAFDGLSMKAVARGDVDGWLLNQFAMDEKEPYLRLATTNELVHPAEGTSISNSVFVLDSDLNIVGSLTGIAPTEWIYSARFIDDTLYLVTFRQMDPLFVISLKDPTNPKIVGELEMPGFSSYLHPVDATHVLGIGSENNSIKVSLYDVSDPTAPIEQSKYVLDGFTYSWSEALYDHKAVLFDLEKNLLVIPIYGYGEYWTEDDVWSWSYISGALVLEVSLEQGISYRGIIDHQVEDNYNYSHYYGIVSRSLYIDDYLYTISDTSIKASMLSDLSEISFLIYRTYDYVYRYGI